MKQIRTSKFSKILAYYLVIMMFLQVTQPTQMYALTEGPSQPEFNSFTPISTSDMVDLASGDLNYNIPIMDVGGYPINLAYNSGVTMDQEASWVGLGWNLNVGQINRQMRGLPDDFNGDPMVYENNMKDNVTVGANFGVHVAAFGVGEGSEKKYNGSASVGVGIKHNNYDGIGFSLTGGLSYQISDNMSVGMQMESSVTDGVSVSPDISFNAKLDKLKMKDTNLGLSAGVSYNSRKGIESMTLSPSIKKNTSTTWQRGTKMDENSFKNSFGIGTTLSYNPDVSFTPTKRVGMKSSNYIFNMNIEAAVYGVDPGFKFGGYRTSQGIDDSEKYKVEKGYGYENTYNANNNDILDFNREKDRTVNRNTTVLPITNYTYDIYSIQGQGVSGMFRPYKGQINYVYDNLVQDKSNGGALGIEIGAGAGHHWGFNGSVTISNSKTKLWSSNNLALPRFKEDKNNLPDYEKIYFKNIGGSHVDNELNLLNNKLGKYSPIKFPIDGSKFGRNIKQRYVKKDNSEINETNSIKRTDRVKRNQAIQKLTRKEAGRYGLSKQFSEYAKDHHTAEIQVTKDGGERYVFGRALYNVTKKEVTFDISGRQGNCETGLVDYLNGDNSANNKRDGDQYFNRITTPAYAHTYLLTTVLSSDYQDIDEVPGPSDDDLGSYTKFKYDKKDNNLYKWRIPFLKNKANYDEGLKSSKKDDKANYQYGEKEQVYIKEIETKTHIAIFETSVRKDGYGVIDENGGLGQDSKSYKLDKIYLYSKAEYEFYGRNAKPIKVAHFEYDYSLCKGIHNNIDYNNSNSQERGKLTLKKVYFTYRKSNMGKYTPYEFNYQNNFDYDMKAYDVWGNYKPTPDNVSCSATGSGSMSNAEFPFVDQMNRDSGNRNNSDIYSSAWHLNSVKLPSGGVIEVNYESDDYAYVQNKEVMQMFKVIGAGDANSNYSNRLFGSEYLYIKTDKPISNSTEFRNKYIKQLTSEPVYFRFLVNMSDPNPLPGANTTDKYDYVTGYLNLDLSNINNIILNNTDPTIVGIKIRSVNKGDGLNAGSDVNPISKAGWNFGRAYLNRLVYGITNEEDTNDLKSIVMELVATVPSVLQIFQSPNGRLQAKEIASRFVPNKSWIRLMQPDGEKFGGGSRVKEIKLHDNWNIMTDNPNYAEYAQFYGQQYSYKKDNGQTSGVATYEPLGCKENPLVKPFYDKNNSGLLLGPDEQNYVEEPIGESFFPSPKITYSKVTVNNLPREKKIDDKDFVVKKHATGKVVTEFYTSYDYPTVVDYTTLSSKYDKSPLASLLNINAKTHLTMSQGFVVHTNDMDGKMKSQRVYAEGQTAYISGVDYKYYDNLNNIKENGLLNNQITTIDSKGYVKESVVGVDYDVINDFRYNESITTTPGIRFNTAGLPLPLIYLIVPTPLPSFSRHENVLKTAVTTKVIHSMGILRETTAYDVGSAVSTKNLAWDAETGEVILTETVNEYSDKYYNFNYPAYWNEEYKGMGQAITNLNIETGIEHIANATYKLKNGNLAKKYLLPGDEIWITQDKENGFVASSMDRPRPFKAWVVEVNDTGFILIDKDGIRVDKYKVDNGVVKIIRSGYRNLQTANMASITSMKNPLSPENIVDNKLKPSLFLTNDWGEYRIINASAIEYENTWAGQCECNLPEMKYQNGNLVFDYPEIDYNSDEIDKIYKESFNPYLYNIKGNWRAKKSHAYLTGRYHSNAITPRVSGFFKQFHPFYVLGSERWQKNTNGNIQKWTFASEVTQYNPYGQEVENMDALGRYSSALYGYNYRFPLAVASNTAYNELAYDGFEDYNFSKCDSLAHFNFQSALDANNITLSNNYFHTGTKSIRVAPKNSDNTSRKAVVKKQVISCSNQTTPSQKNKKATRTKK